MRANVLVAAMTAVIAISISSQSTNAGGLVGLHKKARVDGRLCMIEHWHNGQSGAWRTEEKARAVAIRSWRGLVRIEYGKAWANYHISLHKQMTCEPASGGQTSCRVMAKPCRH